MVAGLLRSFLFVAFVLGFAPPHLARAQAQAFLENPQPGSFQSGIGVISGWVCDLGAAVHDGGGCGGHCASSGWCGDFLAR